MADHKIIPILRDTYLAFIRNSVGGRSFQNFYAEVDGKKKDVADGGVLSCAYFVSAVVHTFGLIRSPHMTVASTVRDFEASGWQKVTGEPEPGDVLVWEEKEFDDGSRHEHIGFALGPAEAVSTSYETGEISLDPLPSRRPVKAIYRTTRLAEEGKFFGGELERLGRLVSDFVDARDWSQFHNPKDLALSLQLEAGELIEHFQWKDEAQAREYLKDPANRKEVADELADILYWLLLASRYFDVDLSEALRLKMKQNQAKYPVSLAKGKARKYNKLA
jgi:dCTP diphosphatase